MGGGASVPIPPFSEIQQPLQQPQFRTKDDEDSRLSLSQEARLARLKGLDIFVLDNSLRETSVCQLIGHVEEDKEAILSSIQDTGIKHIIVACFGDLKRVEDVWLTKLRDEGRIANNFYAFSEMRHAAPVNGIWSLDPIPTGLQRIKEYTIKNVVLEMDFLCRKTNWEIFGTRELCTFIQRRLEYIHKDIYVRSEVFINFRDAPSAWNNVEVRQRMIDLTVFLANLPAPIRPFGLLYEEPAGSCFPWDITGLTVTIRQAMIDSNWTDGHWLVHVHKNYALADAVVLEALACGCTGIWCAVTEEGAGVGHASSLICLTNLARLGNQHVSKRFNITKIRDAAIAVTQRCTGVPPHPKQEVYGKHSTDILWDASGAMGGGDSFDLSKFFGIKPQTRVTTFTTPEMFIERYSISYSSMLPTPTYTIIYMHHFFSRIFGQTHRGLWKPRILS